ncbi:uncharacterized protein LOC134442649, partial [Engraulis encrasicolus]|uniref:uncharacterized protein LOC134442649 n=1 Tax=Engraulis encrasicolus TaxID=184585 RepID=UPI002FD18D48
MELSMAHRVAVWWLANVLGVFTIFYHTLLLVLSERRAKAGHRRAASETIIEALAVESLLQQCVLALWLGLTALDPRCLLGVTYSVLVVAVLVLRFCVLWTTSLLLFFYSTKLVMQPISCYTHAQDFLMRHVIPTLLLIPMVALALCCPLLGILPHYTHDAPIGDSNQNDYDTHNASALANISMPILSAYDTQNASVFLLPACHSLQLSTHVSAVAEEAYLAMLLLMTEVIPGVFMLKSSISIAVHLHLHLRHLRESSNGAHGPRTGPETRVVTMALSLAANYLVYLGVVIYTQYNLWRHQEHAMFLSSLFSSLYSALCGLILLYGKESLWRHLTHLHNATVD